LGPPLWLTVLGRSGYWPVAFLDGEGAEDVGVKSSLFRQQVSLGNAAAESDAGHQLTPEPPSRGWWLLLGAVTIVALLHCGFVWLVYLHPQRARERPVLARIAVFLYQAIVPYPRSAASDGRGVFAITVFLTLALAAIEVIVASSGAVYVLRSGASFSFRWAYFVLPVAGVVALLIVAVQLSRRSNWHIWPAWVCFGIFVALWLVELRGFHLADPRVFFFVYRMLEPGSGVSPGMPVLLFCTVVLVWAFLQIWRHTDANPPDVPDIEDARRLARELNAEMGRVWPLRSWTTTSALALIVVLDSVWNSPIRSIEGQWYDALITVLTALSYLLLLSTWMQVLMIWRRFRRFLECLDRLRMRNAFSRLPKEFTTQPIFHRGRQKPYLLASARCLEILDTIFCHPVLSNVAPWAANSSLRDRVRAAFSVLLGLLTARADVEPWQYPELAQAKQTLQKEILAAADALAAHAAVEFWARGAPEAAHPADKELTSGTNGSDVETVRPLIEDFIAIRFVMYIRAVLDQMRKLMWFVVGSFVLTVAALNVYPFTSRRVIDLFALTIFVTLSVGTIYMLVQMDHDTTLSRLTDTKPDTIGKTFFIRLVSFGSLPLITMLATQFPSIRSLLFSWVEPALQALSTGG
jgi:hypothetical protein